MSDGEVLTFESEDARLAAIAALDESQDSLERLERLQSAPIVPKADGGEGDTGTVAVTQEIQPDVTAAPVDVEPAAGATPEAAPSAFIKELQAAGFTYKNEAEAAKGMKEKEATIERLKTQVREYMRGGGTDAQRRVAELEAEVASMRAAAQKPAATAPLTSGAPSGGVAELQKTLAGINAEIAEMDNMQVGDAFDLPEGFFDRQRNLYKLQAQAMARIADLTVQTAGAAEKQRAQELEARQAREREDQISRSRAATFEEMDAVGADQEFASEYKLTKPAVEVEAEYLSWRADIAAALYGRPARSLEEEDKALDQLQARNPVLLQNCQLAGIPVEPSNDVRSFLALCATLDYRDGWRADSANPGKFIRLQRYDAATGTSIPVTLPDLKTALKQKRLEEGYYAQQVDQAYQRGAQALAAAQSKRDPSVVELNAPTTIGSSGDATSAWAAKFLINVDEEEAMRRYRAGDPSAIEEINKARAICGIEPLTFD